MSFIQEYTTYLQNNPEGYWFKRKLYGWGWTPATKAGWVTTLVFVAIITGVAIASEWYPALVSETELAIVLAVSAVLFSVIVIKTGESPKWQWGKRDGK